MNPEPVAYMYEFALSYNQTKKIYSDWVPYLTKHRPEVPEGAIRKFHPLYAEHTETVYVRVG